MNDIDALVAELVFGDLSLEWQFPEQFQPEQVELCGCGIVQFQGDVHIEYHHEKELISPSSHRRRTIAHPDDVISCEWTGEYYGSTSTGANLLPMTSALRRQGALANDWRVSRANTSLNAVRLTRTGAAVRAALMESNLRDEATLLALKQTVPCKVKIIEAADSPSVVNILNESHQHETHIHQGDGFTNQDRSEMQAGFSDMRSNRRELDESSHTEHDDKPDYTLVTAEQLAGNTPIQSKRISQLLADQGCQPQVKGGGRDNPAQWHYTEAVEALTKIKSGKVKDITWPNTWKELETKISSKFPV